jgi:glutathione synthase/RimK-type ligase-like ATP-grasp enzyme
LRLAFLVPAPDYPEPWRWAFDAEAAALERRGVTVEPVEWTSAADLGAYDLILPLVAWGYHLRYREWLDFLARAERDQLRLANPPALLKWNSDKAYLAQLGKKGIPSVPTIEVPALDKMDLRHAADAFGTNELVVKPPVSASATGTHRIRPGDEIPGSENGQRMLIQPFLPTIATEGEYALIFFDGVFSHALVKRPRHGDFRVQPHLGGTIEKSEAPPGSEQLAMAALAAAPADATYARVDIIRNEEGELRIMELELVEPALWLDVAPHGEEAFASAVIAAAKRARARYPSRKAS